jgi:hypothetical protein
MSHKTLARIAIAMIIVFGLICIAYPRMFNPDSRNPVAVPAAAPAVAP